MVGGGAPPGNKYALTHGQARTPEYKAWDSMKQRCYNPKNRKYPGYGGKGIKVCERWINSSENFLADMGPRPSPEHSLDRIDTYGDYEPKNCRWATIVEQNNNRRPFGRRAPEWIGKDNDTAIPPRVKLRVFDRCGGLCSHCGRRIVGSLRPVYDHIIALINSGENRESNLQLLCHECHGAKTAGDVKEKAVVYRKRIKALGLRRTKRKIPGSRGSGIRIKMDGTIWREKDD